MSIRDIGLYVGMMTSNVIIQQLGAYSGVQTSLLILPLYIGNFCAINVMRCMPTKKDQGSSSGRDVESASSQKLETTVVFVDPPFFYTIVLGMLHVVANLSNLYAISVLGSGLFQVLYSSQPIFIALLSRVLLGTQLSNERWVSLLITIIGLIFAVGHEYLPGEGVESLNVEGGEETLVENEEATEYVAGVVAAIMGAALFACIGVFSEGFLSGKETRFTTAGAPVDGQKFIDFLMRTALCCCLLWFFTSIFPSWDDVVRQPMQRAGSSEQYLLFLSLILSVCQGVQNQSYFAVISRRGGILVGLLNCGVTILVFMLSSFLFCTYDQGQCVTLPKGLGAVVAAGGIVAYSLAT